VLIVDDNETNRKILRYLTTSWGMLPSEAASGPAALNLLRADGAAFAVAVLDYQMPGMDGLQLARAIRGDAATTELPIILLTSLGGCKDASMAELRITAVQSKPVRRARLLHSLQSACGLTGIGETPRETWQQTGSLDVQVRALQAAVAGRILVVEDNIVNQRLAKRLVEKLGYQVDMAADGSEAVTALSRRKYNLVLMDCQMPVMDGFEATRQIRRNITPGQHLPIIAMTASAMQGDKEQCLTAGMDDYIAKPIDFHQLTAVIGRWTSELKAKPL
jgi:CheY-like chemotaxis protein